ncbi:MAG: HDIG domain-containing protein [Clostridia bacterium]|nr:HDIG domain-containing protein [Clostridia bacterium]
MKKISELKISRLSGVIRAVLTGAIAFVLLFALLLTGITPDQYDIHVGQPSSKTVYATKDVEDSVTTEALRQAAASQVEPSYKSVDASVNAAVITDMQTAFDSIRKLRAEFSVPADGISDDMLDSFNAQCPVSISRDSLSTLLSTDDEAFSGFVDAAVAEARDTLNSTLPEGQESAAVTRITRSLLTDEYDANLVSIATEVLKANLRPNMLIDQEITEANRQKAREAVEPEILVKREVIVREGEIVTEAQYKMIESLGLLADDKLDVPLLGGMFLLVLIFCGAIFLYLWLFDQQVLQDNKRLLLLCIIIVLEVAVSLLVRALNSYLMPVAMGAILISILIDTKTAMFVSAMLSFMVSMLVSADGLFSMTMFSILLMAFTAGPVAAFVLSRKQLRTGTLLAGFSVALVNFIVTLSIGLISSSNLKTALTNACWAIGGGVFSAVLAIGLQSLLEWMFNLATNAKLIELSNPNQPLLRRLLMEAPGTYHHSIIVANLAEAGATAVGGNGLLARVGAYYHDVGKLKRPMYFKENQMGDNPHDRTDPRVSTAILTAHSRDGAQMAMKDRLPAQVVDIIRQHHGDSLVLYFYDKAVKLYGEDIDISAFRYEGPRPRSKEAAVVMLADTIEAATRTLANPSPEKMEALIRKLVREKMDDGQLNDSALTFSDLDKICSTFSTVLTGVFHERIEYPEIAIPPREPVIEKVEDVEEEVEELTEAETPAEENTETPAEPEAPVEEEESAH